MQVLLSCGNGVMHKNHKDTGQELQYEERVISVISGIDSGTRYAGLSISETVGIFTLRFLYTIIYSAYTEWCKKKTTTTQNKEN